MSLEDLRKRATAAELTLIDAVVAEVKREARSEVKKAVFEFMTKNPPIIREYGGDPDGQMRTWFARMDEHFALNLK